MNCDILKEVAQGTLSEAEADDVLDAILDSRNAPDAETLLNLSRTEWTAHSQGALWTEIAKWRSDGWPTKCISCGREIHVGEFGWRIVERNDTSCLKHIRCPGE